MASDLNQLSCLGPNVGPFNETSSLECDQVRVPECIDATPLCFDLPPTVVGGRIEVTNNPSKAYRKKGGMKD